MIEFRAHASSSRGNFYTVETNGSTLGIECGISIAKMRKSIDFSVSELDGVLVSHSHADHCRSVAQVAHSGVDIYASGETFSAMRTLALDFYRHRLWELSGRQEQQVADWRILPFAVPHDVAGALGFLIASGDDRLLFACDLAYLPYTFEGLTHIAIECNYSRDLLRESSAPTEQKQRVLRNHMSLEAVLVMLSANDLTHVREIWLLHLSSAHSDAEQFRDAVASATGKPTHVAPEGEG